MVGGGWVGFPGWQGWLEGELKFVAEWGWGAGVQKLLPTPAESQGRAEKYNLHGWCWRVWVEARCSHCDSVCVCLCVCVSVCVCVSIPEEQ